MGKKNIEELNLMDDFLMGSVLVIRWWARRFAGK